MILRAYRERDLEEILALFFRSVHIAAAADYTPAQLDAWAPADPDREKWRASLSAHFSLVAEEEGEIVGFGDADGNYLDRLYVAPERRGRGIGSAICGSLEEYARRTGAQTMTVHASLTAKRFFGGRGYAEKERRTVERRGVLLTNFRMEKIFFGAR